MKESQILHRQLSRRRFLQGATALTGALIAAACGGKAAKKEVKIQPTAIPPIATRELSPTATEIPPTPTPESTATPEPEVILTPEEIIALVDEAVAPFPPQSQLVILAKNDVRNAAKSLQTINPQESHYVTTPINQYGNAALELAELACTNPGNNQKLVEAWKAIRAWVKNFSQENEAAGRLAHGAFERAFSRFFLLPPNCELEGK